MWVNNSHQVDVAVHFMAEWLHSDFDRSLKLIDDWLANHNQPPTTYLSDVLLNAVASLHYTNPERQKKKLFSHIRQEHSVKLYLPSYG